MRGLLLAMLVVCCLPLASAMGLLVPPEFDDVIDFDDDSQFFEVTVVNDGDRNQVDFFVIPDELGYIEVEGRELWTYDFSLDPYESKVVEFEIEGIADTDDELRVQYGFSYKPYNEDNGFGLEQVVSSVFLVEVEDCCDDDLDVEVYASEDGSGGSSGGSSGSSSGGSSGYVPPVDSVVDGGDSGVSSADSPERIGDVAGGNTALTTGVVDDSASRPFVPPSGPTVVEVSSGKSFAILFLGMLVLSMVVQVIAIDAVRKGGEL